MQNSPKIKEFCPLPDAKKDKGKKQPIGYPDKLKQRSVSKKKSSGILAPTWLDYLVPFFVPSQIFPATLQLYKSKPLEMNLIRQSARKLKIHTVTQT